MGELPVAARRNDDEIITRLDRIYKNIEDLRKDKSEIQISSVNEEHWGRTQQSIGLDYKSTSLDAEFPNLNLDLSVRIDAFSWSGDLERSQNGRYHINRRLGFHEAVNDLSFLSTNDNVLPIKLYNNNAKLGH